MNLTRQTAYLVSPPQPCGQMWLWNALLELGVKVNCTAYPGSWLATQQGYELSATVRPALIGVLPAVKNRRYFNFDPSIEIEADHRLTFARDLGGKFLVVVRDARDACYSYNVRFFPEMSLLEHLRSGMFFEKSPSRHQPSLRGIFTLPQPDVWAYYCAFWLALQEESKVKIVRLEDGRAEPQVRIKEAVEFLGLQRSESEINQAAENSSISNARKVAEETAAESKGYSTWHIRKGKVGEYRDVMGPVELATFAGPAAHVLKKLGYDATDIPDFHTPVDFAESEAGLKSVSGLATLLAESEDALSAGRPADAESRLWKCLALTKEKPAAFLHAAALLTALRWTRGIFGDELMKTGAARRVYREFSTMNVMFMRYPGVSYALATTTNYLAAELVGALPRAESLYREVATSHMPRGRKPARMPDVPFHNHEVSASGPDYLESLAIVSKLFATEKFDEAAAFLGNCTARMPYTPIFYLQLGLANERMGNGSAAAWWYERASFLDVGCTEANLRAANLALQRGDVASGIRLTHDAASWDIRNAAVLECLVDLLVATGENARAYECLSRVEEIAPTSPTRQERLQSLAALATA